MLRIVQKSLIIALALLIHYHALGDEPETGSERLGMPPSPAVGVEDSQAWSHTGVSRSAIENLHRNGFTPETYQEWKTFIHEHGGIEHAAQWISAGFSHDEAWGYKVFLDLNVDQATSIRDNQCDGMSPHTEYVIGDDIWKMNPFVATGSCFFVSARVVQLLDKSNVLAIPYASLVEDPSSTVRVDFSPEAAPPENGIFRAIGFAKEPFRYTSVYGEQRIVPYIAIILSKTD